jgi:hypothetical protein
MKVVHVAFQVFTVDKTIGMRAARFGAFVRSWLMVYYMFVEIALPFEKFVTSGMLAGQCAV